MSKGRVSEKQIVKYGEIFNSPVNLSSLISRKNGKRSSVPVEFDFYLGGFTTSRCRES